MDTETQLRQLVEAKELAMHNNPQQMLPKVLETADTLAAGEYKQRAGTAGTASESNGPHAPIGIFFAQLLRDILDHPAVPTSELPFIASRHIDTLLLLLAEQSSATANAILAFAAVYPLLFDLVAKTSDAQLWQKLCAAKAGVVTQWKKYMAGMMDPEGSNDCSTNTACRLALAKCISQCIIVQTNRPAGGSPTSAASAKSSPHGNYIYSINLLSVPDGHPVIGNKAALDKESKQMLDLLLGFLVDEPMMVAPVFIGVINTLAFIMKERPQTTQRIIGGMLKFNVDAKFQPDGVSALNYRLTKRYVERCYRNFVQFGTRNDIIKNAPPTTQQYSKLSKIAQTLFIIGEESKSKGILNFDPAQVERKVPDAERQRVAGYRARLREKINGPAQQAPAPAPAPVPTSQEGSRSSSIVPPPASVVQLQEYTKSKVAAGQFVNTTPVASSNTYSAIFSLMNNGGMDSRQDMSTLPQETLTKLCSEALLRTPTANLISALSVVASRYTDLMAKAASKSTAASSSSSGSATSSSSTKRNIDESESGESNDTPEPKRAKTETEGNEKSQESQVKPEKQQSPELEREADEAEDAMDNGAIDDDDFDLTKLLGKPQRMSEEQKLATAKRIIKHFMAIKDDPVDPAIQVTNSGNGSSLDKVRLVDWKNSESGFLILIRLATRGTEPSGAISNLIRDELLSYILSDFENSISIVIEWLNEEWFSSSVLKMGGNATESEEEDNYTKWSLRALEGLIPFMENQHRRIFIRLMSELPRLDLAHFERIKPILLDPGRSALGFQTLKFLIMFRSPVKETIKTLLEQLISDDQGLEEQCRPILDKYYS